MVADGSELPADRGTRGGRPIEIEDSQDAAGAQPPRTDLERLEAGETVEVQGSGQVPYKLRKSRATLLSGWSGYLGPKQDRQPISKILEEGSRFVPRQLLSILRLSQALARLRFDDVVNQDDISEASRLTDISKASLDHHGVSNQVTDPKSKAFSVLCDYASQLGTQSLSFQKIKDVAIKNAIREHDLLAMLQEYEDLGVLYMSADHTRIDFC